MKIRCEEGAAFKALQKLMAEAAQAKVLKTGFLGDKEYPDTHFTVAQAAMTAEFGNAKKNILPRPIFRPTIATNEKKWRVYLSNLFKDVLKGELEYWAVFEKLGLVIRGDMVETITKIHSPALKPATIRARYNRYSEGYRKGVDINVVLSHKKGRESGKKKEKPHSIEKPLVDTGVLLNAPSYVVEPK